MKSICIVLFAVVTGRAMAAPPPVLEQLNLLGGTVIESAGAADHDSYVEVDGMFTNGCYSWAFGSASQPDASSTILVRAFAYRRLGMCPMHTTAFKQQIPLGDLPPGNYVIRFLNGDASHFDETLSIHSGS